MKSVFNFKQLLIAVATTVMALNLSSCKDQDFDWSNARANTAQAKFSDAFFNAFGKPEEGHQWGFDTPWIKEENGTRTSANPNVNKVESEYISNILKYGVVSNITEREHKEVLDWFTNHKVTWPNTTQVVGHLGKEKLIVNSVDVLFEANSENKYTGDDGKTYIRISDNNTVDESHLYKGGPYVWNYNNYLANADCEDKYDRYNFYFKSGYAYSTIVKGKVVDENGTLIKEGTFVVNNYDAADPNAIVELVNYEGRSTRGTGLMAVSIGELASDNSIKTCMADQPSVWSYSSTTAISTPVGTTIDFTHAWIQHVAFETTVDEYDFDGGAANSNKMNQLRAYNTQDESFHTLDFNASEGYGYGNQKPHTIKDDNTGLSYTLNYNGILVCNENFNNICYSSSVNSGEYHDKWFIVYLKGADYEGWYLGLDLEGGGSNPSEQVSANGVCNDWIIKLSSVNPYVETFPMTCRIMCEDLGGKANHVFNTNERYLVTDIDYNDIVLDVIEEYDSENKVTTGKVQLILQAAGGTLPLTVWYNSEILFETHEMFEKGAFYKDKYAADYKKMYNTGAGDGLGVTTMPKTINLVFMGTDYNVINAKKREYQAANNNVWPDTDNFYFDGTYYLKGNFDLAAIDLKVYRFDVNDYRAEKYSHNFSNNVDEAVWVNLTNMKDEAPLKICVPRTVKWLKEYEAINTGYLDFEKWVADSSKEFWLTDNINTSKLYQ